MVCGVCDALIEMGLVLRGVYRLSLRGTEGMMRGILKLMGHHDAKIPDYTTLSVDPMSRGQGNDKARYVGHIGDFDFWVYQDNYVDDAGVDQKVLPDYTAIVGSPQQIEGVRCYGVIQDEKAGYRAQRYFTKSWLEEDPALRWLLMQSAPLVVPYRPNACLAATVN